MQHAFDWDDLRIFLGASRTGSFSLASQRLGIDTATVARRVARLESALKSTLFVRSRAGLQLTGAGAQLAAIAIDAELAMDAAAQVTSRELVAGVVRISTAEGFGAAVLAPALPELANAWPELRIELAANAAFLSATRREVDMAITLAAPESRRLIVEPLTRYQLGLFASPDYIAKVGLPASERDLDRVMIVGYIDDLLYAPELRYLDEIRPGLKPAIASSSIHAQRQIIGAGGGIGVLPCFLAKGLTPVLPTSVRLERQFWLNTHQDAHGTARMKAVTHWLKTLVVQRQADLIPGR